MVERIVIHLGDCKTGTTAIQRALSEKRYETRRTVHYETPFNHIPLANAIKRSVDFKDPIIKSYVKSLKKGRQEVAIISAEHFEFVPPEKIKAFVDGPLAPWRGKVQLITYIRPHAERLVAAFSERTKKGVFSGSLRDLHILMRDSGTLFYAQRVASLQRCFNSAITFRPYIRPLLTDSDVVKDFLRLSLDDDDLSITPTTANLSLSLEDLSLMRLLQSFLKEQSALPEALRRVIGQEFAELLTKIESANENPILLDRELANDVAETYTHDATQVDALLGGKLFFERLCKIRHDSTCLDRNSNHLQASAADVNRLLLAYAQFLSYLMSSNHDYFIRILRAGGAGKPKVVKNAAWRCLR